MPSGSTSVAAGATTVTITGSFQLPYVIVLSLTWNTTWWITTQIADSVSIEFSTPAPAGGGTVGYQIDVTSTAAAGPTTARLADYLQQVRDLLHDDNADYWSVARLTRFVNQGMQQRDLDMGGNRQILSFALTAGTDLYTFTSVGNANVFDVVSIALIFGTQRIQLGELSRTVLTERFRPSSTYRDVPAAWCRQGPNSVLLAPIPSQAFTTEWDVLTYSSQLVSDSDADPMPYPYTKAVPYYAAYLAKIYERQHDEAEYFIEQYERCVGQMNNMRTGMQPMYSGGRR